MALKSKLLLCFIICTLFSGCTTLGAKALPADRQAYNKAISQSSNNQLLLNIVRLSYTEPAFFLNVDNIAAQLEFQSRLEGGYGYEKDSIIRSLYEAQGKVAYIEKPTISYTPLQGEVFTRRMLTPIDFNDLFILLRSGWSFARVFRVAVSHFGYMKNAAIASAPMTTYVPTYQHFVAFVHIIRRLQRSNGVYFSIDHMKKRVEIVINFSSQHHYQASINKAFRILGIHGHPTKLRLVRSSMPGIKGNIIRVRTRSLLGVLYYLSKGVTIPLADKKHGDVIITRYPNGKIFNWYPVMHNVIDIRYAWRKPYNAAEWAYYHHHWFYISNKDYESKITIDMVQLLFDLLADSVPVNKPVLTVAV